MPSQLTCKEITNPFQVNLHVGDLNQVLEVGITLDDGLEYLFCNSGDDTLEVVVINVGTLASSCRYKWLRLPIER